MTRSALVELIEQLEEERGVRLGSWHTRFLSQTTFVDLASQISLRFENGERIVQSVEFEKLLDELSKESGLF